MGKLTDALDRVVDAAKKYWGLVSAIFGIVAALGAPHVPTEALPWAALLCGFIAYASGFSIGRSVGEDSAEAEERARLEHETDEKIRIMRAQAEIDDRRAAEEQAISLAEKSEEEQRRAADRAAEIESKIAMFSAKQLDLMLRVADAEDVDGHLAIKYGSEDDALSMHLMERRVMLYGDPTNGGRYHWVLYPNWSQFVRQNRGAIEKRLGRDGE